MDRNGSRVAIPFRVMVAFAALVRWEGAAGDQIGGPMALEWAT